MWIKDLLSAIPNTIKGYFSFKSSKVQAKRETELAIINNKTRLALSKLEYNKSWELETLKNKDVFLRRFSFLMLTYMIAIPIINPEMATETYARLDTAPEWLVTIYFSVLSAVWGLSELKNSIPQLVTSWRKVKETK